MFTRVDEFAGLNAEGERELMLSHSMAWLGLERGHGDRGPVLADREAGRRLRSGRLLSEPEADGLLVFGLSDSPTEALVGAAREDLARSPSRGR
ncbi:hypothetical protein [Kitasatospora purpeofusca]|uniref:hypothetical protein n=1 Tax=Kitasatospora purpeofusca TaxID=67352 RepID=UPI003864EF4E|nr:hypothetical protein OIP63_39095 [Kitasatospora purpeofusca]